MLPNFVERDDAGVITCAWKSEPYKDYESGLKNGQDRADTLVEYLSETDDVPTVSRVIRAAGNSKQTPIEIGFFGRVIDLLRRSWAARLSVFIFIAQLPTDGIL